MKFKFWRWGLVLAFLLVFLAGGMVGVGVASWKYYQLVFRPAGDEQAGDLRLQLALASQLRQGEVEAALDRLEAFRRKHGFRFPLAPDPDRSVYAQFATEGIPRTYVINPEGVIVYQCTGYTEGEMAKMIQVIRQQLSPTR